LLLRSRAFENAKDGNNNSSNKIQLRPSPLIGGPKWLPLHVQLIIERQYIWDFVPLNATSPTTLRNLLLLQSVPGEIRCRQRMTVREPNTDTTPATTCSLQQEATIYADSYPNTNLNIINNNCWTFCIGMFLHLLSSSSFTTMPDDA
jgi:hypothetical protein